MHPIEVTLPLSVSYWNILEHLPFLFREKKMVCQLCDELLPPDKSSAPLHRQRRRTKRKRELGRTRVKSCYHSGGLPLSIKTPSHTSTPEKKLMVVQKQQAKESRRLFVPTSETFPYITLLFPFLLLHLFLPLSRI